MCIMPGKGLKLRSVCSTIYTILLLLLRFLSIKKSYFFFFNKARETLARLFFKKSKYKKESPGGRAHRKHEKSQCSDEEKEGMQNGKQHHKFSI